MATSISRVLGLIRETVIANFFGTGSYAQAFFVAFRIPNLLRDIVGEGAMNAAFVPVLTDELTKKGKREFFRLGQILFNILFWVLLFMTLAGIWMSPLIVRLIAPGFVENPEKFQITVTLTKALFPFLMLIGLWAYCMGMLNTLGHFATPAFGPCVLNFVIIFCAMWFGENIFGLTSGVLAGGILQFLMQFPPLYKYGWRFKITNHIVHPQAKKIGKLLIPRGLGACVYQINVFVSTILASLSSIAGEGAVAALQYANRIWQLPLAIFGVAVAQAALPSMSKQVAMNDTRKLRDIILFSLRSLFFILVPSTVGLMILSTPIIKLIFERGKFDFYSTQITSTTLFFYAIGLIGCGGIKVLVNAFYALHDTITPLKTALISVFINIALNFALIGPLKVGGIALANSLAAIFNCIVLYYALRKRISSLGLSKIMDSIFKISLAGLAMGLFCYYLSFKLNVLANIILGIGVYSLTCLLLDVREMKELLSWILRRR